MHGSGDEFRATVPLRLINLIDPAYLGLYIQRSGNIFYILEEGIKELRPLLELVLRLSRGMTLLGGGLDSYKDFKVIASVKKEGKGSLSPLADLYKNDP